MNRLAAAESYLDRGISILPLRPGDKRPVGRWRHLQHERMDAQTASLWFGGRIGVPYGIGAVTGQISGHLTVLDIEPENVAWARANIKLPDAPTVETARGGLHIYCRGPSRCGKLIYEDKLLGDVRGDGGYVVAPPTVIKSGRYVWDQDRWRIDELPLMPEWARTADRGARDGAARLAELDAARPLAPSRAPRSSVHWTGRLPSRALIATRASSEMDYWIVCELIHLGADYDDIALLFSEHPLGANARWHAHVKGSPGYLASTYANALHDVVAEIDRATIVRCHRVITNGGNTTSAQRRATVEVFPTGSSSIFSRSMPMILGIGSQTGQLSGEWQAFCRAFGRDPIPDMIKPRTLARAVLRDGRVERFIDRTVWGLG